MNDKEPRGLLRSFPKVFWVANVMELFERAAYYGMNSVLAIYLSDSVSTGGLGFSEQSIGFLQGLIYALTYVASWAAPWPIATATGRCCWSLSRCLPQAIS